MTYGHVPHFFLSSLPISIRCIWSACWYSSHSLSSAGNLVAKSRYALLSVRGFGGDSPPITDRQRLKVVPFPAFSGGGGGDVPAAEGGGALSSQRTIVTRPTSFRYPQTNRYLLDTLFYLAALKKARASSTQ